MHDDLPVYELGLGIFVELLVKPLAPGPLVGQQTLQLFHQRRQPGRIHELIESRSHTQTLTAVRLTVNLSAPRRRATLRL